MSLLEPVEPDPGMEAGDPTTLYDYARDLLSAAHGALAETSGGQIARRYVSPGLPSLDCSSLVVVPAGLTLIAHAGAGALGGGHGHRLGRVNQATFQVLVARECVPVTKTQSNASAPNPLQLEPWGRTPSEDVWTIWCAIPRLMADNQLFGGPARSATPRARRRSRRRA